MNKIKIPAIARLWAPLVDSKKRLLCDRATVPATKKWLLSMWIGVFLFASSTVSAQLANYTFSGSSSACPNVNNTSAQPTNAVVSPYTNVGGTCVGSKNEFVITDINNSGSIKTGEYNTFTISPNTGYSLNLTGLQFTQYVSDYNGTTWALRSSLDNYTANIATGIVTSVQLFSIATLPAATFSSTGAVTFRFYLINAGDKKGTWTVDNLQLFGSVNLSVATPATPPNPTSNSPQCVSPGVTITRSGSPPAAETWYWQTAANGTSTTTSSASITVNTAGTYYLRAQNNVTKVWSTGAGSTTVAITPGVGATSFAAGSTSTRCQGNNTVTYTATATNASSITYALDNASLTAGNTINSASGAVKFTAAWTGTSTITATSAGCGAATTSATHKVTSMPSVTAPVFNSGSASVVCQAPGKITYTASANNTTLITYSIDTASENAGNLIKQDGKLTYVDTWTGTTIVTASAAGCNGPLTATHTVTIVPNVGTPVFGAGATSVRCQGAGKVVYGATASNTTGITYTLDFTSQLTGNVINASTGEVTYVASWSGTSVITASADGCAGPVSSTHSATTTQTVGTPVFAKGASSTVCQNPGIITYTATASNSTGIVYTLDIASKTGGNVIDTSTGKVTYAATWTGTTTVTATAAGCNGPSTAKHTVTISPSVGTPVFSAGFSSTHCQAANTVTYTATASNATGYTYSLDAASLSGGNTINATNGAVTYVAAWTGVSVITVKAAGCNGPSSAQHTATSTPDGTPSFTNGTTSTRCQMAGTVNYTAVASNGSSVFYSLDASSISAGNTINSTTGDVTYVTGWNGTSTITATVTGCNGQRTANHTATSSSNGTPSFVLGTASVRMQGAGTTTYTATSSNGGSVTYSLDTASLNAGIKINSSTGDVTFTAGWRNQTIVSATVTGCSGLATATHTIITNRVPVTKQLYLSDPVRSLDRIDPAATGDTTDAATTTLSTTTSGSVKSISFTQSPTLCSALTIKAGQYLGVTTYVNVTRGTMPVNPAITATLRYGPTKIITLSKPVFNSSTNVITWADTLTTDVTVPEDQAISLDITTTEPAADFIVNYDSKKYPSHIDLPVSTYITITALDGYNAAYPGGKVVTSAVNNATNYIRATVTDPFGYKDITGLTYVISPSVGTVYPTVADSSTCSRVYEYPWYTTSSSGNYNIKGEAKEGYENSVISTRTTNLNFCSTCPPVAVNDSSSGAGGSPIIIDVLANDYDPNNDMDTTSLVITKQPQNGSALRNGSKIVYLPNGVFTGLDTISYQICDRTSPTALCATGQVFLSIDPTVVDPCSDASKSHIYYVPYPEADARTALLASASPSFSYNISNIRSIISLKMPYPGMKIIWDHWEDGYETNLQNPQQSSTLVWGDGNPYNGIAPGYSNDIIPAGGSIVLDNTMPVNPRVATNIYYDGRDKIYSSGQITMTQALGEPTYFGVQAMKTNISSTADFGQSFTIPVGQNFNSQDFKYTALFIRASADSTIINIDKDNNGSFETNAVLNEGQSLLVNGGVLNGAIITSSAPVGVDLHFGGVDLFSSREAPIYPATWYSNTYYTPVPTTHSPDSAVVMFYNSLSRPINIKWNSGAPANGTIAIPAKTVIRFPLALSATSTYKFVNPTGEAYTAIEIVDSYTPGGGGNDGSTFDWAFNLIAEERLTTFATIAWAPGSTDGTRNDNPIWVTPANNTTIYVKYDGDVLNGGTKASCGLRYDVSYPLNALNYKRILDVSDKDQSGTAIFTCGGTKIAAVYGEDPSTAQTANPSWDVGSTIQPFCALKLLLANDDNAFTLTSHAVTIDVLKNDVGFQAVVDPNTILFDGVLQPKHGTVAINPNGTLLYTPDPGYTGLDSLEYNVCSTPSPVVCDVALVIIKIDACPTPTNQNIISGQVFLDKNKDGLNNDGGAGFNQAKVYLYSDANCTGSISSSQIKDSIITDKSGGYQFITYPEKLIQDDFDDGAGNSTCASGSDGTKKWLTDWKDSGDPSVGFCVTPAQSYANTNAEIFKDGSFGFAMRLKNPNVSVYRTADLSGATAAYLTFSYRRAAASMTSGRNILVQASSNGTTFSTIYTIPGKGTVDASYITVYNQNILPYASANTYIRFLTTSSFGGNDTVFIDNLSIAFLKYPQCYITKVDPSNISPKYYFTTASQNALTASSGGTCLFPFDFGVAGTSMNISGTLYNDANGLSDNAVNGTVIGTPSGVNIYAYLVDSVGQIEFKTTVNSSTGTYAFPLANVFSRYTLTLSTVDSPLYTTPPTSANLPLGWVATGEAYGIANMAGTGIKSGQPSLSISVVSTATNISQLNFGIEQLPSPGLGKSSVINPGGMSIYIIPNTGFNNVKNSTDISPGIVKSLRINTFPTNTNTLSVNGTLYTASSFPSSGIVVPATAAGVPTQSIGVDPVDGFAKVVLTFYAIDNAGMESLATGSAVVQLLIDTDKDNVADINDIDDDNDGIPDVVEVCGNGATSFSCIPGGSDPSGDDDDDGIVNYKDAQYGALNAAGCVAVLDTDGDGIPDYLDRDSDNDGIPDVVEAFGVDANGDGIIDNFTDTDGDGLSQNVDANNSGAAGSGQGLGFKDFDRDGIPNTRDLDSDNDGIPDLVEAGGTDMNNEGRVDSFIDQDGDGIDDNHELGNALILTGPDNNNDGFADYYPYKNPDQLRYPNPYDIDSDGDGIVDAIEAGFPASVNISNGRVTGVSSNGWANSVQSLVTLVLRNTDNLGPADYLDIDSDDDGISDNIEGQPTFSYIVPTDLDTDGDGLVDVYDLSISSFGGGGITPYDNDYDGIPDYIDTDTDNDGAPDINEASNLPDLSAATINTADLDGDGMLDEFDKILMNTLAQGTRYKNISNSNMGPGGNFDGPLPTGSNVKLIRSLTSGDRDWRSTYVLPLTIISFAGTLHNNTALLSWNAENGADVSKYIVQRSMDGRTFKDVGAVKSKNQPSSFYTYDDDLTDLAYETIYYRIRQVNKNGDSFYSRVIAFKKDSDADLQLTLHPNPVTETLFVTVQSASRQTGIVTLYDAAGQPVVKKTYKLDKGNNSFKLEKLNRLSGGVYMLQLALQEKTYVERIVKE